MFKSLKTRKSVSFRRDSALNFEPKLLFIQNLFLGAKLAAELWRKTPRKPLSASGKFSGKRIHLGFVSGKFSKYI